MSELEAKLNRILQEHQHESGLHMIGGRSRLVARLVLAEAFQVTEADMNALEFANLDAKAIAIMKIHLLGELLAAQGGDLPALCGELLQNYKDGRIKMWTALRILRARR